MVGSGSIAEVVSRGSSISSMSHRGGGVGHRGMSVGHGSSSQRGMSVGNGSSSPECDIPYQVAGFSRRPYDDRQVTYEELAAEVPPSHLDETGEITERLNRK